LEMAANEPASYREISMSPILKAQSSGEATIVATPPRRDMTRCEAAQYTTDHWFPCSPKTLAKLAVIGGGPSFRKAGRVPLYSEASVDGWAAGKIGPLVNSTSELAVSLGKELHAEKSGAADDEIASRRAKSGSPAQDPEQSGRSPPPVCARHRAVSGGGR
jgi:hypothetical protein